MAQLQLADVKKYLASNKYPSVGLDSSYGTTVTISLDKVDMVYEYVISVALGTLSGGTSPAWNVSASNPIIQHVKIEYDNDTFVDLDSPLLQEYLKVTANFSPNGLIFRIPVADLNYITKKYFEGTGQPTYNYTQLKMYLTIAPLSSITSGSPTGSSGTTLYLQEKVLRRIDAPAVVLNVKYVQLQKQLGQVGDNDLTDFLPRVGAYKTLMYFASSSQPSLNSFSNYGTGTDSLINYLELILNGRFKVTESYWNLLKQEDLAEFNVSPDAGYALQAFMKDDTINNMLYLGDTNAITEVDVKANTSSTGWLTALAVQYL